MVFELNALSEFLFDDGFSTLALVDVEEEEEEEEHSPISVIYFFVLVLSRLLLMCLQTHVALRVTKVVQVKA